MSASSQNGVDPLELETLDTESLLTALANVEKAIPDLLLDVKPVLAHLVSRDTTFPSLNSTVGTGSSGPISDEDTGIEARDAVERYMTTLDKIQFILRQTVYYLRETRAAPSALRPPPIDGVPRPLAATLRSEPGLPGSGTGAGIEPSLGLYGARVEVTALREMRDALHALRVGDYGDAVEDQGKHEGRADSDEMVSSNPD